MGVNALRDFTLSPGRYLLTGRLSGALASVKCFLGSQRRACAFACAASGSRAAIAVFIFAAIPFSCHSPLLLTAFVCTKGADLQHQWSGHWPLSGCAWSRRLPGPGLGVESHTACARRSSIPTKSSSRRPPPTSAPPMAPRSANTTGDVSWTRVAGPPATARARATRAGPVTSVCDLNTASAPSDRRLAT